MASKYCQAGKDQADPTPGGKGELFAQQQDTQGRCGEWLCQRHSDSCGRWQGQQPANVQQIRQCSGDQAQVQRHQESLWLLQPAQIYKKQKWRQNQCAATEGHGSDGIGGLVLQQFLAGQRVQRIGGASAKGKQDSRQIDDHGTARPDQQKTASDGEERRPEPEAGQAGSQEDI